MHTWKIALLALTIIMEARNQPDLGKAMVAQVAVNRGGPDNVEQNLFWPDQFAVWGKDVYAPGISLRLAVLQCWSIDAFPDDPWCIERWADAHYPKWWRQLHVGSQEYWLHVWEIAEDVYDGTYDLPDQLQHKTHFDNPNNHPDGFPGWMTNCVEIGDHVFCD